MSCRMPLVVLVTLALVACSEHAPAWYGFADAGGSQNIGTSGDTEPTTTHAEVTTGEPPSTTTGATGAGDSASTSDSPSTTDRPSTGSGDQEFLQPRILAVNMPETVHIGGPVALTVTTENTSIARARLDGVELDLLKDEGDGTFTGVVPIFGAVDNGDHVLQVIAEDGNFADLRDVPFSVAAPAPGTPAWGLVHPTGSTTRRVVLTAAGDVIEVGGLDVDGLSRPSLRKRSPINGAELWPEGTIVLDERRGTAAGVALLPDGRMWVAMNVRELNNQWRPRIVLLDAQAHETGVEMPGEPGAIVTAIASDDAGGFFAVGYAVTAWGDTDIVAWRMNGSHAPVFSAKPWDYLPNGLLDDPHEFTDFAFDVVVKDAVAWVAGASQGKHDLQHLDIRGIIVRMEVETGAPLDPVTVAAPSLGGWRHSEFHGAAPHPEGLLVIGNATTEDGTLQRIEISAFTAEGTRFTFLPEPPASVAIGNAVAMNAHGIYVGAGAVQDGNAFRGVVYGRGKSPFKLQFPPSNEHSMASGLAIDPYDQVFVGGDMNFGGVTQARIARVSQ